ncbi:MAG TPA: thiamine pyrophosphate-dependent dehydrogenase E1 component subunit alpha [Oligoflexia bacterium]|nr:thiamine pyrophosphate-dependent dehydrogenase E1 component subunit alpha [Oligoflexia bacterium]
MSKPRLVSSQTTQTKFRLAPELLVKIHDLMVKARTLEERLIKMYKQNDGYFWIGGPGEESFNVPLGLLIKKGQGPKYDYFHGHYRSSAVLLAMGADPFDTIRQMKNTANDPYSGGRNFVNHQSIQKWNVCPISSPIEVQYSMAPGTAIANKRAGGDGISIVVGGDAGTAEGDFATCLVWSSRPVNELPLLICVTNNKWGISTSADTQHGDRCIADRGKAFGMRTMTFNGLDPEESYLKLKEAMDYVRTERKPLLLEAQVSRLYGHSSASGANFIVNEEDPLKTFEARLESGGILSKNEIQKIWDGYNEQMLNFARQAREEPQPDPESIWDHIYCGQKGRVDRYW